MFRIVSIKFRRPWSCKPFFQPKIHLSGQTSSFPFPWNEIQFRFQNMQEDIMFPVARLWLAGVSRCWALIGWKLKSRVLLPDRPAVPLAPMSLELCLLHDTWYTDLSGRSSWHETLIWIYAVRKPYIIECSLHLFRVFLSKFVKIKYYLILIQS